MVRQRALRPSRSSTASTVSSAISRYVVSLPPAMPTTPAGPDRHPVAPGQVGRAPARRRLDERAQPGPDARHVVGRDAGGHGRVQRVEHVADVVGRARRVVERAVVVGVGRADVGVAERAVVAWSPRHDEQAALVAADGDDDGDVVAHLVPRHGEVDALRRADRVGVDAVLQRPHLVGPHAGGVDDDRGRRTSKRRPSALDGGPVDLAGGVLGEGDDPAAVGDDGAVVGRRAGDRQHEPGVVGGGVVVQVAAREPLAGRSSAGGRRRRRP